MPFETSDIFMTSDQMIMTEEGVSKGDAMRARMSFLTAQNSAILTQTQFADAKAGALMTILGVIAIKLAEISLITPPVGLNVYVVRSASPIPLRLEEVFAGVMPFLAIDVLTLLLLIAVPEITLALPSLMR